MKDIKHLDESITQYEEMHARQDLQAFKELLDATKNLLAEHSSRNRSLESYQSGSFEKLPSVQRFMVAYEQVTAQLNDRMGIIQAALERDQVRMEALHAEERTKKGAMDLVFGVLTVLAGFSALAMSGGTAFPIVAPMLKIAGVGMYLLGSSNSFEGVQNIILGSIGDGKTVAFNPIRDTIFFGNAELYNHVGQVFLLTTGVLIPIAQTKSIAQGFSQFFWGTVGGLATGQAAYHGTKLLGGNEETAQLMNLFGNFVGGGYAAYKAASKFSLNKVSTNPREYSYNMIENPGPLPEINETAANSFASGKYNVKILEEDTVFFRAGNSDNPVGQYYTRDIPESVIKVRIESAVKPQWIDRDTGHLTGTSELTDIYATKFPKGTVYYEGPTGSQGGVYIGGKEQIFINKPWTIDGIHNNTTHLGGIR